MTLSTYGMGATGLYRKLNKNLDLNLSSYTKINPKWLTDLNVKCKTVLPSVGEKKQEKIFEIEI